MENKNRPKKKQGKSLTKRITGWLHLWPSIVSGIILVFVCLTGTIIVYCDEIMDWSAGDAKYVEVPKNPHRLSDIEIKNIIKSENPNAAISEYVFFKDPERSTRIRLFTPKEKKIANVYINPYTGKILKTDYTIYFFFITAHLHSSLLAGPVGGWIVAISTIIFVISTITGLILWWPKRWTKATRDASFKIKWKARFKRLNYDLHNVFGFYSLIICFVLGTTGLIIFFEPLSNLTIKATGGDLIHIEENVPKIDSTKTPKDLVAIAYQVLDKNENEKEISIWDSEKRPVGAYIYRLGKAGLKSVEGAKWYVANKYTAEEIKIKPTILQHDKTENIIWQLHMGQWWGQLGKLFSFLSGIIATSLPITGFLIWWGRRNKKSKKKTEVNNIHQHRKDLRNEELA